MADGADVAYSFPMLNSKKIVGYLGDLNIHVSEQVSCDTYVCEGRQHTHNLQQYSCRCLSPRRRGWCLRLTTTTLLYLPIDT